MAYGIIVIAIVIWRVIIFENFIAELVFLWVIPVLLIFMGVLVIWKLRQVYAQLVPTYCGEGIRTVLVRYLDTEAVRDIIPKPQYLRGHMPPPHDPAYMRRYLGFNVNAIKATCAYIFLWRPPSRHELLFWLDCYGIHFLVSYMQVLSVIATF